MSSRFLKAFRLSKKTCISFSRGVEAQLKDIDYGLEKPYDNPLVVAQLT
jgi:hypothetical protein